MTRVDDPTTLQRTAGHLSSPVGDETVVLSDDGVYFGLEGIGGAIWDWLQEPITFGDLVDRVTAEYDVDDATARRDAQTFVDGLLDAGLAETK